MNEYKMSDKDKVMMDDMYNSVDVANKIVQLRNDRRLKVIERVKGKTYIKNLMKLFKDCEVGEHWLITSEYSIVRYRRGQYQTESYGKDIKGYWVEQWSVGDSGDSWEGYVYVQIVPGKWIKVPYSI